MLAIGNDARSTALADLEQRCNVANRKPLHAFHCTVHSPDRNPENYVLTATVITVQ
jgi:hypothetical protein